MTVSISQIMTVTQSVMPAGTPTKIHGVTIGTEPQSVADTE